MKKGILFLSFIILTQANPLCAMYGGHHKGHKPSGPRSSILKAAPPLLTLAIILSLATPASGLGDFAGHCDSFDSACIREKMARPEQRTAPNFGLFGGEFYAQQLARDYEARNRADEQQRRAMEYQRHIQDIGWQQGRR